MLTSALPQRPAPQLGTSTRFPPAHVPCPPPVSIFHAGTCLGSLPQQGHNKATSSGKGRHVLVRAGPADKNASLRKSFDSDEDLDAGLAADLAAAVDPERLKNMAKKLDMAWSMRKRGKPATCATCHGTGENECQWCHGTGYCMLGDTLIRNRPGLSASSCCPVCKGKGACKCEKCVGTGFRANWLP